jgi:hypothetical protein
LFSCPDLLDFPFRFQPFLLVHAGLHLDHTSEKRSQKHLQTNVMLLLLLLLLLLVSLPCRLRIYRYYLPIYFWVQQQLRQHKAKYPGTAAPPLVVRPALQAHPCFHM